MVNDLKLLIKSNRKTFISILLLTMLGVGFLVGMKSNVPNLKYTVTSYLDRLNVFDLELTSSIGFTKDDVVSFGKVDGIKKIEGSYSKDFIVKGNNDDYVLRIHSYINSDDGINRLELIEGSYPKNEDEIVVEEMLYKNQDYKLGDKITLNSDLLKNNDLKIVGVVKSPLYLSNNKGSTNLLSGRVNYYAYVNFNNIDSDLYSAIYVELDNKKDSDKVIGKLKEVGKEVIEKRYQETIVELNEKITNGQNEIDARKKEADEKIKQYELEIENAEMLIASADESIPTVDEARRILANKQAELAKVKAELDNAAAQIAAARSEYDAAVNEYQEATVYFKEFLYEIYKDLPDAAKYYDYYLDSYQKQLDNAKTQLDSKQYEYDLTYAEYQKVANALNASSPEEYINSAKREIENKKVLLNNRKQELEDAKKKTNDEFQAFQNQLDDAKDYLKLISVNGWKINKREDIPSYSQYLNDINRIDKIGNFFPVIFYVVAVLITLTNISRIVTNEREKIGLYKALGYSNQYIGSNYVLFSAMAALIGAVLGSIVGLYLIPRIFYNVYKIIYYLPQFKYTINYLIIIIAVLIALILVVLSAYFSIKETIYTWPAILLRPKEIGKGKRVFLENISAIWDKLDFTNKVTFRNMFKYPKRFIMMILGISGCISLIISGFNIRTAISNIIPLQFGHVFDVDAEIFFKDSVSRGDTQTEKERIIGLNEVDDAILSYVKYVYLNDNTLRANLVVPEDSDLILDFVTFENRGKQYELSDEGAIITKKVAQIMNIKTGDMIKLTDVENNQFEVKVVSIVNNYVDNYIYVTNDYYNEVVGNYPKYNALLVRTTDDKFNEEQLSNKFNETNNVSYLVYTSTSKIMYDTLTKSLNYIVYILVVSAIILAFIVLYNLNSLNVEERKREIATIRVLGFYHKETYRYIENEIKRLTLIGIVIGLFLGYIFSNILIKSCELDNLMYDYSINILNYIFAIIITIVFMIGTSLLGRRSIEKINMIESLKKIE